MVTLHPNSVVSLILRFVVSILNNITAADLPEILPGCIPDHVVSWAWAYWLPMLVFESGLFLLAIFRLLQLGFYKCDKRTSNLLVVLLRDSVMYFGGVLAVILANFVAWKASRVSGRVYAVKHSADVLSSNYGRLPRL